MKTTFALKGKTYSVEVSKTGSQFRIEIDGKIYNVKDVAYTNSILQFQVDNKKIKILTKIDKDKVIWGNRDGKTVKINKQQSFRNNIAQHTSEGELRSPMPAQIIEVLVAEGESVVIGQPIILLEAMKMEMKVVAPFDGVVDSVSVEQGQQVDKGQGLAIISPNAE